MTPLVVLSHPEPTSFAAALARTAAETLDATLLDLYAEGFDPRLSAADFTNREDPARLREALVSARREAASTSAMCW